MNVYVLYIDTEKSRKYADECLQSIKKFPNLKPIMVEGYNGVDYTEICERYDLTIIPFYLNQMSENSDVLNKAFSCTAGHMKIWQMIRDSGEMGVVLEHDAIVKYDLSNVPLSADCLTWLGPRVEQIDDYRFPYKEFQLLDTKRFEGTHGYAISPSVADTLIKSLQKHGLNDSLDGQLGMRNIFDLEFKLVEPPVVVAAIGDRESCIERSGNCGFWNAENTPGFLAGLKPQAAVPPERKLLLDDKLFDITFNTWDYIVETVGNVKRNCVLQIGANDGTLSKFLVDRLCSQSDSLFFCSSSYPNENAFNVYQHNVYFSKYYYNVRITPPLDFSQNHFENVQFNLIVIDEQSNVATNLANIAYSWSKLMNGTLVIRNMQNPTIKRSVDLFFENRKDYNTIAVCDEILAMRKCR